MESETAAQADRTGIADEASAIEIRIPADPRFVRPVRLATGGLATLGNFDVEAIDDLRIAVDELCAALIESGTGAPVDLQLSLGARGLRVEGSTPAGTAPVDEARFALSRQILSVIADDYGFDIVDGRARCWVVRGGGPSSHLEADEARFSG